MEQKNKREKKLKKSKKYLKKNKNTKSRVGCVPFRNEITALSINPRLFMLKRKEQLKRNKKLSDEQMGICCRSKKSRYKNIENTHLLNKNNNHKNHKNMKNDSNNNNNGSKKNQYAWMRH